MWRGVGMRNKRIEKAYQIPHVPAICPHRAKHVDALLKIYAYAELEAEREGLDIDSVYWKKVREYNSDCKRRRAKKKK